MRLTLVYHSFDAAERARSALLDAGFASRDIELEVPADEAGPVAGNFVLGNGRATARGATDPTAYRPYEENFRHVADAAATVLSIELADARRRDEAARIATGFGGRELR
jgi:hypothetical protein